MKHVYKTRPFSRWMRKTDLMESTLCRAISEMERGLIDANLGAGLFKKRVSMPGRGKRGSARTLLATNREDKWFFLWGFEKNERANISIDELEALKAIATEWLQTSQKEISSLFSQGAIEEICHDTDI